MTTLYDSLGLGRPSVADRLALAHEIWDRLAADSAQLPLTDAQRQVLERRADDDDANPDDTVPWEQVKAEALARWKP